MRLGFTQANTLGQSQRSDELRLDTERLRQTLQIATAARAELEALCQQQGISHHGQPTPTLRQALKQRIGR
ncbi:MAG: hypothetical protein ACRBC3_05680 [Burkholderiaceae bacterium]